MLCAIVNYHQLDESVFFYTVHVQTFICHNNNFLFGNSSSGCMCTYGYTSCHVNEADCDVGPILPDDSEWE